MLLNITLIIISTTMPIHFQLTNVLCFVFTLNLYFNWVCTVYLLISDF